MLHIRRPVFAAVSLGLSLAEPWLTSVADRVAGAGGAAWSGAVEAVA